MPWKECSAMEERLRFVARLLEGEDGDVRVPAQSTVHAVLDRHGLVKRAKTRRNKAMGTTLVDVAQPNALWCADFKGEFRLGNRAYCYPPDRHRPGLPLHSDVRGPAVHARTRRLHSLPAPVCGAWPARCHPHRQWPAFRFPKRPL